MSTMQRLGKSQRAVLEWMRQNTQYGTVTACEVGAALYDKTSSYGGSAKTPGRAKTAWASRILRRLCVLGLIIRTCRAPLRYYAVVEDASKD